MMRRIFTIAAGVFAVHVYAQDLVTSAPFELYGDHIFLSLSVDDSRPMEFIFDTGDGLAVIDTDVAEELQLVPDHSERKTSAQGSISGVLIEHNKLEINEVKLEDIELYTTDLNHIERTIGRNIDGIIGYDLLKNYVIQLDYDLMLFKIYAKDTFRYAGQGESFDFQLIHYIPTIEASVTLNNEEQYRELFFVSTGAGTTLDFNTPFANKHEVIVKTGKHYSYPVAGLEDNETMHYEGRVKRFTLGSIHLTELPVGISQAEHGVQHNKKAAGIIGNGLLKRFNVTFDYAKGKIYLDANQRNAEPFKVNASGLNLQYGKNMEKLLVHRVYAGSPAEAVGIRENAELLEVDGKNISELELPEIRHILEDVNKTVKIKYRQDGAEQQVALELKPLI